MKQKTGSTVMGCGDEVQTNAIYLIAAYARRSGARGRFDNKRRFLKAPHPRCLFDRSTMKTDHAGSMRLVGHKGLGRRMDGARGSSGIQINAQKQEMPQ